MFIYLGYFTRSLHGLPTKYERLSMPPVQNSLIGYYLAASFIAGGIYKTRIAISRLYGLLIFILDVF